MKKISFVLLLLSSFASADWLLNTNYHCVKSYDFNPSNGRLIYIASHDNKSYTITTKNVADDLFPDYEYNSTTGLCTSSLKSTLGLSSLDFNNLNGFIGIFVTFLMIWSIIL